MFLSANLLLGESCFNRWYGQGLRPSRVWIQNTKMSSELKNDDRTIVCALAVTVSIVAFTIAVGRRTRISREASLRAPKR